MKNPALIIIVLCLVGITAPLIHAAENAYVYCGSEPDSPKQVPVFTAPGSAWAVAQLPCGQPVTLLSLDRGYAKIQSGNQVGYVVSAFILKQETQEDLKARIDQLESEVRTLKSQDRKSVV